MADTEKDIVYVEIVASQRVCYKQTKKMTRAEWAELKAMSENDLKCEDGPLADRLDLREVLNADQFEDLHLSIVDNKGHSVSPPDTIEMW